MRGLARRAISPLQALVPKSSSGVLVLAYHLVAGETSLAVDLPMPVFERQMEELKRRGTVTTLSRAVDDLEAGTVPAPGTFVVTFDDAYANFQSQAWPVLERLGIPVTLFVPTGFVDGRIPPPIRGTEGMQPLSWSQLGELSASPLLDIGSHTRTHPDLRKLDQASVWRELVESKADLEDRLGRPVSAFCYPRALVTARLEATVGQVYRCAVAAGGRRVHSGFRRSSISRLPLRREMTENLGRLFDSSVWLEEYLASIARRWT